MTISLKKFFERKIDVFILIVFISVILIDIFFLFYSPSVLSSDVPLLIRKIEACSRKKWHISDDNDISHLSSRIPFLKEKIFYEKWFSRDIFYPVQVDIEKKNIDLNTYVLMNIERKKIPFVWMGIFKDKKNKTFFVQMNSKKGTFFLKKGDRIEGYVLKTITPHYIDIEKEETKLLLRIKKRQIVLEKLPRAKIYDKKNKKFFIVKEGEFLEGWVVHSILKDSVVLKKAGLGILITKQGSVSR